MMKSLSLLALVAGAVAQKPARFSNLLKATLESAMENQKQNHNEEEIKIVFFQDWSRWQASAEQARY